MNVRVIQVIEATGLRGVGTDTNPHRTVTAYFTLDGELLAERDPCKNAQQQLAQQDAEAKAD